MDKLSNRLSEPMLGKEMYFVSSYLEPPGLAGLSLQRHDHAVALWKVTEGQIQLVRYWELERRSGAKHHRLPIVDTNVALGYLDALLAEEGLSVDQLSGMWGTPGFQTINPMLDDLAPSGYAVHSLCHLASSIASDFARYRDDLIIGLAVDAGPDFHLEDNAPDHIYSALISRRGQLDFYPAESPAGLWLQARGRYGMEEGTLMALGSATNCSVPIDLDLVMRNLRFESSREVFPNSDQLLDRFDEAVDTALSHKSGRERHGVDDRFSFVENRVSACMKLVAQASARIIDRTVDNLLRYDVDTTQAYLALSGGFSLNCPNNTRMMNKYGFRGLLTPPCIDDSGQALGLGLSGFLAADAPARFDFSLTHAYYGSPLRDVDRALVDHEDLICAVTEWTPSSVVKDLQEGPIGWIRGAAEIGPRALGHRSLLGDPRSMATKRRLNELKQRAWWRPVAPMVLEDFVAEWFVEARPSPYMLEAFHVIEDRMSLIPAVVHLDGTARVQTVAPYLEPTLSAVLEAFYIDTGVPVLANTSLNDKGEPMVNTVAEALNFCLRKGVRSLYVDDLCVTLDLPETGTVELVGPLRRADEVFVAEAARREELWEEWESMGLSPASLFLFEYQPGLRPQVDLTTAAGRRRLQRAADIWLRLMPSEDRAFIEHVVETYGPGADITNLETNPALVGAGVGGIPTTAGTRRRG